MHRVECDVVLWYAHFSHVSGYILSIVCVRFLCACFSIAVRCGRGRRQNLHDAYEEFLTDIARVCRHGMLWPSCWSDLCFALSEDTVFVMVTLHGCSFMCMNGTRLFL